MKPSHTFNLKYKANSKEKDLDDLVIVNYGVVQKEVDGMPDVVVTNVYNLVDVLNECIEDYHERHKDG